MNAAQHAFVREQFTKWVEATDVAEQCGLTRKELIDSVQLNIPLVTTGGVRVSDDVWRVLGG